MSSSTKIILFTMLCTGLLTTVACDHSNPSKMNMPETYGTVVLQTKTTQVKAHPKVDILFVIDNSTSMDVHQKKLTASIDSFVEAFAENQSLDYHIGVVPIFDSTRYGKVVSKFNPNGQLTPMPSPLPNQPINFYARAHNNTEVLKQLLKIGVDTFSKTTGPEVEESFSPVLAAFSEPMLSSVANKDFYREDAHLVVIFITDAEDASPSLSGEQLYNHLLNLKQQDYTKIHTYGVLADKNDPKCINVDPSVSKSPSKKPDKIINFISLSRGKKLSICEENYGPMLSEMGKEIEVKASKQQIFLDSIPEISTLCICKAGDDCKTIQADGTNKCIKEGWKYDPANISIVFSDVAAIASSEDEQTNVQLEVSYTPVKIQNVINGRTRRSTNR